MRDKRRRLLESFEPSHSTEAEEEPFIPSAADMVYKINPLFCGWDFITNPRWVPGPDDTQYSLRDLINTYLPQWHRLVETGPQLDVSAHLAKQYSWLKFDSFWKRTK